MGLGVELGEIRVHRGTETDHGSFVVACVMEHIGSDDHGVFWDSSWGLSFPKHFTSLTKDLEGDVVHNGHVHFWFLVSITTTSASASSWVRLIQKNGVDLDD